MGGFGSVFFSVMTAGVKNLLSTGFQFLPGCHFSGSLAKEKRLLLGFFLSVPMVVSRYMTSAPSLGYNRQIQNPGKSNGIVPLAQVPSQSAFFSPPLEVFLCLFCV